MEQKKFESLIEDKIRFYRPRNAGRYPKEDITPVARVIPKPIKCGDCGLTAAGIQQEIYLWKPGTKHEHWRKKCLTCKLVVDFPPRNRLK